MVISVTAVSPAATHETTAPAPVPGDMLITAAALRAAWPAALPLQPRALIIRSQPKPDAENAAYLTREAAQFIVAQGIEHLVVDLPSLDRGADGGVLTAHRVFFGMPAGSQTLAEATRPACTITELAHVPATVMDGVALLQLQAPRLPGDAVPSRPMLYECSVTG